MKVQNAMFLLSLMVLQGCGMNPNIAQGVGTVGGGVLGALTGAQFGKGRGRLLATAAGAIFGGLAGGMLSRHLSEEDQKNAECAAEEAFSSGDPVQWKNPQNGHYGQITPQPVIYQRGKVCRKFTHLAYIDGKPVEVHGMAQQQRDGSWKVMP
jgi:surface antigen